MRGRTTHAAWAAAVLFVCVAATASAQQTGQIRGRITSAADGLGLEGVVIVARSPAVQMEQFGFTEPDGSFVIPLLPPGTYTLELSGEGFHPRSVDGVEVALGQTRFVSAELVPTALEAERIVVTAPRTPAVDQGSWELGTNLERSFIRNTPSGRLYTEVLRETPGATEDLVGISVFGATGAENSYVIEGLNTTGIGFGLAETELPIDFFDEIEIKTAGYMPEHGRSLGGIYNLVLRRGGNEFHGDVFLNISPGALQLSANEVGRRGEAIGRRDDLLADLDVGFAVGGPIIPDRLWFFVGANPRFRLTNVHRTYRTRVAGPDLDEDGLADPLVGADGRDVLREVGSDRQVRDTTFYYLAGKLTLALATDHRLELSYFGNPYRTHGVQRAIDDSRFSNGLSGDLEYMLGTRRRSSHNVALNYSGQFLDRALVVEAFAGVHTERDKLGRQGGGPSIEYLYDQALDDLEPGRCPENPDTPFIDCLVSDYIRGETAFYDENLTRWSAGLGLTHLIGDHTIGYGVETEIKSYDSVRGFAGGYEEVRYGPDPNEDPYAFERFYYARQQGDDVILFGTDGRGPFHANVSNLTIAAYLQDTWEINRYVTVGGGVRWDFEQIRDAQGEPIITIPDEIAPRLGVSFDPTGDGRSRIFLSYGWFYESIPLDLNQRSFSAEGFGIRYVDDAGDFICFDDEGNPVPGGAPPDCTYDPYGVLGGQNSPVVRDLGGQYHEEAVLGGEYDLGDGFVVGLSGVFRRLLQAVEDISPDDGNNYFLANPGVNDCDVPMEYREPLAEVCSVDGEYDPNHTVFPEPQRRYIGMVLSARKKMRDHWQLLASYTLSRNFGNYTGLFSADNEQLDPNITSQYDLPGLLENRRGPLPNDHTHQIKISGAYQLGGITDTLEGLTIGLRYQGQSGSPISYLGRHELYGRREAFILPRGDAGRTPFLHQVDTMVGYDIGLARDVVLNLNFTVFNVLNFQRAVVVDQEYTTDVVEPHPGGTRLRDLRNADDEPVNVNPTFGEPRRLQPPLYVRLGARLSF